MEWSGFKLECSFCPQVAARPVESSDFDIDVLQCTEYSENDLPVTLLFLDSVYYVLALSKFHTL